MLVKVTAKRQVTFPKHVLDALGVGPGDQLELTESPDGFILRPRRIDYSPAWGRFETRFLTDTRPSTSATFRDQRERGHGPWVRR